MLSARLLPFCLLVVLAGPAAADEELPPDAKKLIDEHEKATDEILDKAEAALKKAQEAKQKAEEEAAERKVKLIARLEELAKNLEKQGKLNQAKIIAEAADEIRTGRVAGARPDPGTVDGLRGQNGKDFLFEVTGANNGSIWGTDIYTDDSNLATAAVHAGVLQVGQKGIVKVTILPGENGYQGSNRNGIQTGNYGAWQGSFKVAAGKARRALAPRGGAGAAADPGTLQNFRGQIGKTIVFEVTGNANGSVWGTGIYTDDSTLATAAVHAGVLKAGEKGLVKVTILPGEQQYPDSTQNGVTSGAYGEWNGSFKVEAVKK